MANTFSNLLSLFRRNPLSDSHVMDDLKTEIIIQEKENAEIRDRMAIERTKFANERTFLAYIRTSLSLAISGLAFLEFFDNNIFKWIGSTFIFASIIAGFIGLIRFKRKQEKIRHHKHDYVPTSPIHAHVAEAEKEQQQEEEEEKQKPL